MTKIVSLCIGNYNRHQKLGTLYKRVSFFIAKMQFLVFHLTKKVGAGVTQMGSCLTLNKTRLQNRTKTTRTR